LREDNTFVHSIAICYAEEDPHQDRNVRRNIVLNIDFYYTNCKSKNLLHACHSLRVLIKFCATLTAKARTAI